MALPFPEQANALTQAGRPLVVTGITEGFTIFLKISIVVGCIIALPVVLYQAWAFIAPGLIEREKKYAIPFIFTGMLLFLESTLLKAAHGTAIDVQRLPSHPDGVLTAQIPDAAIYISARSSPLDHPLLDELFKGFRGVMALGSLGVDWTRSDPIAGDARIGHLLGQAVGELIEGKLADRVDTTRLISLRLPI